MGEPEAAVRVDAERAGRPKSVEPASRSDTSGKRQHARRRPRERSAVNESKLALSSASGEGKLDRHVPDGAENPRHQRARSGVGGVEVPSYRRERRQSHRRIDQFDSSAAFPDGGQHHDSPGLPTTESPRDPGAHLRARGGLSPPRGRTLPDIYRQPVTVDLTRRNRQPHREPPERARRRGSASGPVLAAEDSSSSPRVPSDLSATTAARPFSALSARSFGQSSRRPSIPQASTAVPTDPARAPSHSPLCGDNRSSGQDDPGQGTCVDGRQPSQQQQHGSATGCGDPHGESSGGVPVKPEAGPTVALSEAQLRTLSVYPRRTRNVMLLCLGLGLYALVSMQCLCLYRGMCYGGTVSVGASVRAVYSTTVSLAVIPSAVTLLLGVTPLAAVAAWAHIPALHAGAAVVTSVAAVLLLSAGIGSLSLLQPASTLDALASAAWAGLSPAALTASYADSFASLRREARDDVLAIGIAALVGAAVTGTLAFLQALVSAHHVSAATVAARMDAASRYTQLLALQQANGWSLPGGLRAPNGQPKSALDGPQPSSQSEYTQGSGIAASDVHQLQQPGSSGRGEDQPQLQLPLPPWAMAPNGTPYPWGNGLKQGGGLPYPYPSTFGAGYHHSMSNSGRLAQACGIGSGAGACGPWVYLQRSPVATLYELDPSCAVLSCRVSTATLAKRLQALDPAFVDIPSSGCERLLLSAHNCMCGASGAITGVLTCRCLGATAPQLLPGQPPDDWLTAQFYPAPRQLPIDLVALMADGTTSLVLAMLALVTCGACGRPGQLRAPLPSLAQLQCATTGSLGLIGRAWAAFVAWLRLACGCFFAGWPPSQQQQQQQFHASTHSRYSSTSAWQPTTPSNSRTSGFYQGEPKTSRMHEGNEATLGVGNNGISAGAAYRGADSVRGSEYRGADLVRGSEYREAGEGPRSSQYREGEGRPGHSYGPSYSEGPVGSFRRGSFQGQDGLGPGGQYTSWGHGESTQFDRPPSSAPYPGHYGAQQRPVSSGGLPPYGNGSTGSSSSSYSGTAAAAMGAIYRDQSMGGNPPIFPATPLASPRPPVYGPSESFGTNPHRRFSVPNDRAAGADAARSTRQLPDYHRHGLSTPTPHASGERGAAEATFTVPFLPLSNSMRNPQIPWAQEGPTPTGAGTGRTSFPNGPRSYSSQGRYETASGYSSTQSAGGLASGRSSVDGGRDFMSPRRFNGMQGGPPGEPDREGSGLRRDGGGARDSFVRHDPDGVHAIAHVPAPPPRPGFGQC